jgi:hypothetical protein
MNVKYLNLALIFGLLAVASPAAFAHSAQVCPVGLPTAEASCLLTQIKDQALEVRNLSDTLYSLDEDGTQNMWQYDASLLQEARTHVNDMDQLLYQLRAIPGMTTFAEKRTLALVAPSVVELTDTTQDAIVYLGEHQDALMFPPYRDDAEVMYNKASRIVNFVNDYQNYVLERAKARELRSGLGLPS